MEPQGPAAAAGLRSGDVITKINGEAVFSVNTAALAGKDVKLTVLRGSAETEIPMKVGSREFQTFSLAEMTGATPQQAAVRNAWLKR